MTKTEKIKAIQGILGVEQDGIWGPESQAALDELTKGKPEGKIYSGKGSWYTQYEGEYTWIDTGDEPGSSALGVPDDEQGIALYNQKTLGKWFYVTAPNKKTLKLQQTDIGPHPKTGRKIDIAAVAAERFGYSPKNFPTDEIFHWKSAT